MRQVLVTGATGFIGCRLAEVAVARGIPVVGLVRQWSHAARLGRLPVRLVGGDVLHPDSLRGAMSDCDVVFHCAVDNRAGGKAHRATSVQGTVNVMQAALELGVKRVVHLSSTAVYSYQPRPEAATEEGMYRYSGDVYCDGKIDGEKAALRYWHDHGLPVSVLRPTIVYGPFGFHTAQTATIIRDRRMVLLNGGAGICNSLYVDNLVEAMLLAADHAGAPGQVFHISDATPVSWKEFIEAHARALGDSYLPLPEMTGQGMEAAWAKLAAYGRANSSWKQGLRLIRDPETREALKSLPLVKPSLHMGKSLAKAALPASIRQSLRQRLLNSNTSGSPMNSSSSGPRSILSRSELSMFTLFSEVAFSTEKARRILGYEPAIDFSEGMRRSAAWIQWARL